MSEPTISEIREAWKQGYSRAQDIPTLLVEIDRLRDENKIAVEALEQYASIPDFTHQGTCYLAKSALARIRKMRGE